MPFGNQPIRGGKSATVSVAASDTQNKAGCDFISDGTCDEITINNAIASLPASGGEIYLCEGTYNVCGPIIIDKDNVTIIGAGASTVIRVRDGHNADMNVIEATNFDNLLIKDLRIDGNRANQTAGIMNGIYFDTVTYSKVESCWVNNIYLTVLGGDAIFLNNSSYNTILNNTCYSNGNDGVYVEGGSYNTIVGNTCVDSVGSDGIDINLGHDNTVIGNICQGNNDQGIYIRSSNHNTLEGNACRDNDGEGIQLIDADYNVICDNRVGSNGVSHGIYLNASNFNTITGNICRSNNHYGIYLYSSSDYNMVVGNSSGGNGWHGIGIVDGSDNNTIAGNNIYSNGRGADVTYDGIFLEDSDYNSIQDNLIRTVLMPPPPNRQRYGINISNAGCGGNLVANNDLHQSGQSGGYNDVGTNTRGTVTGEVSPTGNTLVVAASNSLDPVRADFYCDGVSDETEINAAITALGATGGTVKLLEGTYSIADSINLATLTALVGQGAGTVLRIPNLSNGTFAVINGASINRVLVRDLRIDGNKANQTAGTMEGIYFDTVTNSKVESCWVEDLRAGNGIYLTGSSNNMIANNTCHRDEYGITLTSSSSYNTVAGNNVQGSDDHGIRIITDSDHNIIADNEVVNNSLSTDNIYDGIWVVGSNYNNVQGNTVRTTVGAPPPNRQRYGINVSNAACIGNLVKDNDLHQSGQTGAFNDAGTGTRLPELWVNSIFDDSDASTTLSNIGHHVSLALAAAADANVHFNFRVPSDFHQLVRARIVVVPVGTGDLQWRAETDWGLCGEIVATGTGATGVQITGVVANQIACLDVNAALDGITAGDHVGVNFNRMGDQPGDTVGAVVHLLQFWMQYV